MTIGVDLSALQGPHRMRGIGYALMSFINNISAADRQKHAFVFFVEPYESVQFGDPLELLNTKGLNYEIRFIAGRSIGEAKPQPPSTPQQLWNLVPGKVRRVFGLGPRFWRAAVKVAAYHRGDSRQQDLSGLDVYLQPDQMLSLPRKRGLRRALIIYDLIPYVLDGDYLTSYRLSRRRGHSVTRSVLNGGGRWMYLHKLKVNTRHANLLLSISEHTKHDFMRLVNVPEHKIKVAPLGVSATASNDVPKPQLNRYVSTSWGYIPRPYNLPDDVPFILYVGGADSRRRISDLVSAFNGLRAEGYNLKLVLAGDIMQGPLNIPVIETQAALRSSSYINDIVFLGFADDSTRDWLYQNALVFVYPSIYEGFGLPVLEALAYGCPVICYENGAVREVGGKLPTYARNAEDIRRGVIKLLQSDDKKLSDAHRRNKEHSLMFSWKKTSDTMIDGLEALSSKKQSN